MSLYLTKLHIRHLRSIEAAQLLLSPGRTALLGANASGKTSLLEAIYMLGTGRSFLTPRPVQAIQHDRQELILFGEISDGVKPAVALGVSRDRNGGYTARLNGETVRGASQMAASLPLQLITPETLSFIVQEPKQRRAYLDLGLFHTKPQFKTTIQEYRQYLKQRNAWLSSSGQGDKQECVAWEAGLVRTGEQITAMRNAYLKDLQLYFEPVVLELLADLKIEIRLQPGWNSKTSLAEALEAGRESDRAVGYTQSGPHRADLMVLVDGKKAKEVLSRGQQKMLACALKFAQERLFRQVSDGRSSLFLIDDLASELDDRCLAAVLQQIVRLDSQVLLTMLNQTTYNKMMHLTDSQTAPEGFFSAAFNLKSGLIQPLCSM